MSHQILTRGQLPALGQSAEHRAADFAIVLSAQELLDLEHSCVETVAALHQLIYGLWNGAAELIAPRIPIPGGIDWIAFLLQVSHGRYGCTRCDVIRGASGWKVVEINVANAGGWDIPAISPQYLEGGCPFRVLDTTSILFKHLTDLARRQAVHTPKGPVQIALVAAKALLKPDREELARTVAGAVAAAAERYRDSRQTLVQIGSWQDFQFEGEEARIGNKDVHLIFELDIVDCAERMRAAYLASVGKVTLIPGPLSQLLNDKRLLAALSEHSDLLHCQRVNIPWTRTMRPGKSMRHGRQIDLESEAKHAQAELVLKRALSDGGRDVYIGRENDRGSWVALVSRAMAEQDWIIQEWVEPEIVEDTATFMCANRVPHHLIWGGFVVDGHFAGGFARVLAANGYSANGHSAQARLTPVSATRNADELVPVFPLIVMDTDI